VLVAAGRGDPIPLVREEAARRAELALPPFGGLAVLSGDPAAVDVASRALADGLAVADLATARAAGRLRVDVDPQRE